MDPSVLAAAPEAKEARTLRHARPLRPIGPSPTLAASEPEHVGPYEIIEPIASGGMARIDVAFAPHLAGPHRFVALKRMRAEHAHDDRFRELFALEARVSASLAHPNIVKCLDAGETPDGPYIAFELVDGPSLNELVRRLAPSRLSVPEILDICAQVGSALAYTHALRDDRGNPRRLVHRDVTPHNVLISRTGVAKLTDFGIAHFEGRAVFTRRGHTRGKPGFMAPEVVSGGTPSDKSDVYSLGVMLLELIAAKEILPRLVLKVKDLDHPISQVLAERPSAAVLDPLLRAMLSVDPTRRPTSSELVDRLVALRSLLPLDRRSARSPSP